MKKKNTLFLVSLLSFLFLFPLQNPKAAVFSDVSPTHTYYDDIMYLLDKNVIEEANTFGLSKIVTREEVAVMIAKALQLDSTPRDTIFDDVSSSNKNSGYIQSAVEAGIIKGYSDGQFKPNTEVTRGHMATFIARALDLPAGSKTFSDVPKGHTAYDAVGQLAAANITTGYSDGTFKPSNNLTRAHISAFLARAIRYHETGVAIPVPPQNSTTDLSNTAVSLSDAVNVFRNVHASAQIYSVELKPIFRKLYYKIKALDQSREYEMLIDANTKQILSDKSEVEYDRESILNFNTIVDPTIALKVASNHYLVSGISPTSWELEMDNGKQLYKIKYEKKSPEIELEVIINASTGKLLYVDVDD